MKNKIYQIIRKVLARILTENLGRVYISDDEIICYVSKRKIKDFKNDNIMVFASKVLGDKWYKGFKVDKPVHYIIEDAEFNSIVKISSSRRNCHVTFRNCVFTNAILIRAGDYFTFDDCKFKLQSCNNNDADGKNEFVMRTYKDKSFVNKIEFINNRLVVYRCSSMPDNCTNGNISPESIEASVSIDLSAKNIEYRLRDICEASRINISSDSLIVKNSSINAGKVNISSGSSIVKNSFINAGEVNVSSRRINCYNNIIEATSIAATYIKYSGESSRFNCDNISANVLESGRTDKNTRQGEITKEIKPSSFGNGKYNIKRGKVHAKVRRR